MTEPFLGLIRFELREQLRRPATWGYFGGFLLVAWVLSAAHAGVWPELDLGDPVLLSSAPRVVAQWMLILSILGVPVTAALAGAAVQRDFDTGIHPLFFTTPIPRWAYLGGRLLGAVAANLIVLLAVPVGIVAGLYTPGADPGRIGPFDPWAYAQPFALFVVPNLLLAAAVFIVLAALTRRAIAFQAGGVALLLGWAVSRLFASVIDVDWLTELSDPFGTGPFERATRYWTVVEQNALLLPLTDGVVANRLLWLGVAGAVVALGISGFRFSQFASEEGAGRPVPEREPPTRAPGGRLPPVARSFGHRARAAQFAGMVRSSLRQVLRSPWFHLLGGLCLLLVLLDGTQVGVIYGTETYPVTYQVLELVSGTFMLFLVLLITIYAGELVWEEREQRAAQLHDSLPVPNWLPVSAKITALAGLVVVLLGACMVAGITIQASRGYFRIEPGLYLVELFVVQLPTYLLLIVLAVALQSVVNHKYVGHLLLLLYFLSLPLLYGGGMEHNLFHYAATPQTLYSDMNGYGHTLAPFAWYTLFWAGVALLLGVATHLFWVRGEETGRGWRLRIARVRVTRPVVGAVASASLLVLATGGFVIHRTTVLNDFRSGEEQERIQAEYEKLYKRFEALPQPRITAARLQVEIHPRERELRVRGAYRLVNHTAASIDTLHVDLPNTLKIHRLDPGRGAERVIADRERGYYAFRLPAPLAPGDSTELRFDVAHLTRGFENEPSFRPVVENGTFFDSQLLPGIGYNALGELVEEPARARHGLPERPRAAPLDDPLGRMRNFVARDADRIRFHVTVGTAGDQVAVAPGSLKRQWTRGDRRYFEYEMDAPMLNFYAFLSARYTVRRDRWREVEIEVYHHPGHEYNVDRMIRGVKRSLEYYTEQFGPYQHRQVRILEFPRYAEFAQSFASTIPYSEGIGFIANVGADDIDYPFFVTAHEVAHQWWGHQVAPADVQGAALLSETLAEYSALMVMEREHGRGRIGRFLRYELDAYLQGRGGERRGEMPLSRVEDQQYIHYNKGALAMYALRDYIGEARLNGALRAFLREWRFRGPPYPTSRDLLRHLRAATPDSLQGVVTDLFEEVTLWDLAATDARYEEMEGGGFAVEIDVEPWKVYADAFGEEHDAPTEDWIDIAVFGSAGEEEPLYLAKHRLDVPVDDSAGVRTIRVRVDGIPVRAGIDPYHKLIDRNLGDNTIKVRRLPRPRRPEAPAR